MTVTSWSSVTAMAPWGVAPAMVTVLPGTPTAVMVQGFDPAWQWTP